MSVLSSTVRTLALIALLALVGSSVALAGSEKDTIKRSFSVDRGGTLYIDVDRGNVIVETIGGTQVHVEMERTVDARTTEDIKRVLARHNWEIEQDGDDVVIESRFDSEDRDRRRGWGNDGRFRLLVTVKVPRDYNVDFNTGAGNVTIADLRGYIEGRTGAGNITLGETQGDVEVRSGSGNVEIMGVEGTLAVQSGAGNIVLGYVAGEIDANTGAGNITARITRQPGDDSRLQSGAGNVVVYLEDNIGLRVDARASVGSASCDFGLEIEGKWMSKSFGGRINGGGPDLVLRSGVGNVALKRL